MPCGCLPLGERKIRKNKKFHTGSKTALRVESFYPYASALRSNIAGIRLLTLRRGIAPVTAFSTIFAGNSAYRRLLRNMRNSCAPDRSAAYQKIMVTAIQSTSCKGSNDMVLSPWMQTQAPR